MVNQDVYIFTYMVNQDLHIFTSMVNQDLYIYTSMVNQGWSILKIIPRLEYLNPGKEKGIFIIKFIFLIAHKQIRKKHLISQINLMVSNSVPDLLSIMGTLDLPVLISKVIYSAKTETIIKSWENLERVRI